MLFRQALVLGRALLAPSSDVTQPLELTFRVLPNDLDVNGHLNNARYLNFVDLAHINFFVGSGFLRVAWKNRWKPVSGGSVVQYRRSLAPLERFRLRLTLQGWDEAWSYFRFEFLAGDEVRALGFTKGAVVGEQGRIPTKEVWAALGNRVPPRPLPDDVLAWIECDRLLGDRAKTR